ncbi:hypothetical protein OC846_004793 [Tilletia horrida]|uniref:Uncharacterized protein n=1 Tax=Tilletia horrida TaxID=155126 RepID=A0AAN6GLY6_9BASI|nr:hypothetical protein OC846_004793 [Tilletia horrida]KAK0563085.1 hypothetical protein OC861_004992 [Tilletia horrida]
MSLPVKVIRIETRSEALTTSSSSTKSVRDIGDWPVWQTAIVVGGGLAALGGGIYGLRYLLKEFQGARELNTAVFPTGFNSMHPNGRELSSDKDRADTKLLGA